MVNFIIKLIWEIGGYNMKKILLSLMVVTSLFLVGCTKVEEKGLYKEGTYFGSFNDTSARPYTATAVVSVDKAGFITGVVVDATYVKDGVSTTKKALGDKYGMKAASPIGKEWYEQVEVLEAKVVDEQGLSWLTWKDDTKTTTDAVSGVTIKVNILTEAIDNALEKAKK